jgi:hypothetical protein
MGFWGTKTKARSVALAEQPTPLLRTAEAQQIAEMNEAMVLMEREITRLQGQKSTITTSQPIPEPVAPQRTGWQPKPLGMRRGWLQREADWLLRGGRSSAPAVRSCPLTTDVGGGHEGYCPMAENYNH